MFKKIVVVFITKKFKSKSFMVGLGLAQKFEGNLTIIDCVYRKPPKFVFFETKDDKKSYLKTKKEISSKLAKFEKTAKDVGVPAKIKVAFTDSITDWIIDYVNENRTDLLIIDHPHLSEFEKDHYEFIINAITENIKTPVLLLRS